MRPNVALYQHDAERHWKSLLKTDVAFAPRHLWCRVCQAHGLSVLCLFVFYWMDRTMKKLLMLTVVGLFVLNVSGCARSRRNACETYVAPPAPCAPYGASSGTYVGPPMVIQ